MRGDFLERRQTARIAFDRDDARPLREQRARQAAGAGSNFDDDRVVEGSCGAGDARSEIEVEQKILAERFFRVESIARDDVAQRRQSVDHLTDASCKFDRFDQARRIGDSFAGDVERPFHDRATCARREAPA